MKEPSLLQKHVEICGSINPCLSNDVSNFEYREVVINLVSLGLLFTNRETLTRYLEPMSGRRKVSMGRHREGKYLNRSWNPSVEIKVGHDVPFHLCRGRISKDPLHHKITLINTNTTSSTSTSTFTYVFVDWWTVYTISILVKRHPCVFPLRIRRET